MTEPADDTMINPEQPVVETSKVSSFFGMAGDEVLATFNPRTPAGARMLVQSTLEELEGLEKVIGKDIFIAHIFSHPASGTNKETGETDSWRRIVLLDGKGAAYSCGSLGIGKSLGIIGLCRGDPPWMPPVKCKVVMQRLNNGNSWYQLIPDADSLSVMPPKRKPK